MSVTTTPERPRLRATITGHVDPDDPDWVWLYDQARITRQHMRVRRELIPILELFDGSRDLRDVQVALLRHTGGRLFPSETLSDLVEKLDEAIFLDSPRLQARYERFLKSSVREPACIGSYEGDPKALREQLKDCFCGPRGPGPIRDLSPDGRIGGALIPHIDFARGGPTFAWGFKEVVERSDASLFVIIGTSHYSGHRFILTHKDFETPLGVAETDKDFVNRLACYHGNQVFADEVAHLPEHSIEFHVVFLQYCLGERRPFKIVPLLVGPFADCVQGKTAPHEQADIYSMIKALQRAAAESGQRVCYLSSGDLAHVGPKFGDPDPVQARQLQASRRQDEAILQSMEAADRSRFADIIFAEGDARRICGFPPTYLLLSVLEPVRGKSLHYDQYVEPNGFESVSFASVAFYP